MQALPSTTRVILLATVALNAANPKRNKSSKVPVSGHGGYGASGAGDKQINHKRAMSFSSPDFGGSRSSARRSPTSHSFTSDRSSSRHTRTQSLNRNVPHTPSATTFMGDILHSRNPSSGGTARSWGKEGKQGGPCGNSKRVQ